MDIAVPGQPWPGRNGVRSASRSSSSSPSRRPPSSTSARGGRDWRPTSDPRPTAHSSTYGTATSTSPMADLQSEHLLVGGPENETAVGSTLDGRTFVFGRAVSGGSVVMTADPDGRNVRRLNSNVVSGTTTEGFMGSPDGKTLAVISSAQSPATLELLPLDGGNERRVLPLDDRGAGTSPGYRQTATSWCSSAIRTAI